ncbi:HpcH/HpaI aldolase/citrate lyase family protein [Leifsonia poae]|uniref:HpcH/HpaI aldolase/citrate lyase family protein n=1 Tax=Leifsonia poae TaxID=110933 RepID=UPI003D665335
MTERVITGLYVPGDRPDRFDKAVATGAGMIILDLEDAVAPEAKPAALEAVTSWLRARASGSAAERPDENCVVQVRVNAGVDHEIVAVRDSGADVELRIPKVEHARDLDRVAEQAAGLPLTALIETALGVENAAAIAAHPAATRVALGESDLASDIGTRDALALDYARVRLLFAARAAGLPAPMLSAYPDIRDLDGLRADTERGRRLGWVGRTAIHPSQLAVIADVFAPTDAELDWARSVLAAVEAGGVATLASGEMVDPAMLGRARSILGS